MYVIGDNRSLRLWFKWLGPDDFKHSLIYDLAEKIEMRFLDPIPRESR